MTETTNPAARSPEDKGLTEELIERTRSEGEPDRFTGSISKIGVM